MSGRASAAAHGSLRCIDVPGRDASLAAMWHAPATRPVRGGVLVFVHDHAAGRLGRDRFACELAQRAARAGFHALRFDCRGFGESPGEAIGDRMTPFLDRQSRDLGDVVAWVRDELGDLPLTLCGECCGFLSALDVAVRCAPRARVVGIAAMRPLLWSALPDADPEQHYAWHRVRPAMAEIAHDVLERLARSPARGFAAFYRQLRQRAAQRFPPADLPEPLGQRIQELLAGLTRGVKAEFYTVETRKPAVYRGNPFQVEVGLAYGGDLPKDSLAKVLRFANRVPLLYQAGACCISKAAMEVSS